MRSKSKFVTLEQQGKLTLPQYLTASNLTMLEFYHWWLSKSKGTDNFPATLYKEQWDLMLDAFKTLRQDLI